MAVEGIFTYYITGDYASIGCNSSASGDIVIPETIGGYTVNKILSYGFENPNITSIVLPNSITEISDYAFCNCSSLASINIPNNITSIGIMAFKNTALTSFNWPANITRIPGSCFYGSQLASINIPEGVKYIDNQAFAWSQLSDINLPSTILSFGVNTFTGCAFTDMDWWPSNITTIPEGCLSNNNFVDLIIPNYIVNIGQYAFSQCESLTSVVIPSSVNIISNFAFCQCDVLSKVIMTEGLTTIGDYVFSLCWKLTHLIIPLSVTNITNRTFKDEYEYSTKAIRRIDILSDSLVIPYNSIPKGTSIAGYNPSDAKTYAENNNIPFYEITDGLIKEIEVLSLPYKLSYGFSEELNFTGIQIEAQYYDDTYEVSTSVPRESISGYNEISTVDGKQKITFVLDGIGFSFEIDYVYEKPTFSHGSGTVEDPYWVTSARDLNAVRFYYNKSFLQVADIDLSSILNWKPLGLDIDGYEAPIFTGNYDGNNYEIKNLTISSCEYNYIGLFSHHEGDATNSIKNVKLKNISISIDIIPFNNKFGSVYIGGLLGRSNEAVLQNCSVEGSIELYNSTGGFTRFNDNDVLIGGIVGEIKYGREVSNCINKCNIIGDGRIGGLIGRYYRGLEGTGVFGMINCFNMGNITHNLAKKDNIGAYLGGLIGDSVDIEGVVSENCYSCGQINTTNTKGGLIGIAQGGSIISSYYDSEISGCSDTRGTGKTTAEMKLQATFVDWDFTTEWSIDEGNNYPQLKLKTLQNGDGTEATPYEVWNKYDLDAIRGKYIGDIVSYQLPLYFIQKADIDLSGFLNWIPIGQILEDSSFYFTGEYDGENNTIYNLTIGQLTSSGLGLFLSLGAPDNEFISKIKNLKIQNASVVGQSVVGGLVGSSHGNIENCSVEGIIVAIEDRVGGLVGVNHGLIEKCSTFTTVGDNLVSTSGGLVGLASATSIIRNCFSRDKTISGYGTGGLIGVLEDGALVVNCYASNTINPKEATGYGGLIGISNDTIGNIASAYYNLEISGCSDTGKGEPKTTAEMFLQETYIDWDFVDIWDIDSEENGGYPFFKVVEAIAVEPLLGSGTAEDPYQVSTAQQLNQVRENLSAYYIQTAHIDLSSYPDWEPIGGVDSIDNAFTGNYDGNYYKIRNLSVSTGVFMEEMSLCGLFGIILDMGLMTGDPNAIPPVIKNIILENVNINGSTISGALMAYNYGGTVENCASSGIVNSVGYAGGLIGGNIYGSVSNSFSSCSVTSTSLEEPMAGGLIAMCFGGTIDKCYSTGLVTAMEEYPETKGGLLTSGEDYTVTASYYDSETSGCSDTGKGDPKTTAEMKIQATYVDWNFNDLWVIDPEKNSGYPYFIQAIAKDKGSGTLEDPYKVSTPADLDNVRNNLSAYYIQTAHIDLSEYPDWVPIGTVTFEGEEVDFNTAFSGSYDGNGYKISNLTVLTGVNTGEGFAGGLFGACADIGFMTTGELSENPPTFKNIMLENVNINGGEEMVYAGALVGCVAGATISKCSVSGSVSGGHMAGGVIGVGANVTIDNCFVSCSVITPNMIAGSIVGICEVGVIITNCYGNGIISCGYVTEMNIILMAYGGQIVSSYYDSDIAGISAEFDPDYPGYHIATPKTTAEMKQQETYVGWDFDTVWGIDPTINDGYPYLKVFVNEEIPTIYQAVIFQDDCSSLDNWTICTDEGHVHYGELFADGDCIYITQENINNNYYDSRQDFYQDCSIGLQDFILEAQIKYEYSKPQREQVASITLYNTENPWERIGFIIQPNIDYSGMKGGLYCTNAGSFTFSQNLNYTDDILTYKLCRTGNVLDLYINDIKRGTYENSEIGLVNISGININLGKSRLTDESSLKIPAIYDINISQPLYQFTNGAGTEADPYLVETAADLNGVRDYLSSHFKQTADIDLSGYENWIPIGYDESNFVMFTGNYNGNGFSITNLTSTINGLFFVIGGNASLTNINVSGCITVTPPVDYAFMVGSLASFTYNSSATFSNCASNVNIAISSGGSLSLESGVGGLIGASYEGSYDTFTSCCVNGSITVDGSTEILIGGFVGFVFDGNFSDCYALNSVSILNVENCYGAGFVGNMLSGQIKNCYSTGRVSGSGTSLFLGGFATNIEGYGAVTMTSCYYDSETSGQSDTGKGEPKTTAEMKQQATYTDWDFETIWGIDPTINDGYPYLKVFVNEEIPTIYQFANGAGTEADPYQVWTSNDLNGVRDYLDAYFIQMADIDLSEFVWTSIGENVNSFQGNYNGNGYIITNITEPLFGVTVNAILQKIGLVDANIINGVGVLVEDCRGGTIEQCYSTGSITGYGKVGGLIGTIQNWIDDINVSIRDCFSTCEVTNNSTYESDSVGGLIGRVGYTFSVYEMIRCFSCGIVNNPNALIDVGGMIGYFSSYNPPDISSCYYDSEASGYSDSKGTPKTTAEMKQQATFVGWDFDTVWGIDPAINDGYPYLKVFVNEEIPTIYQFTYGSGTELDPYQVWTADDLNGVRDYLDAYFIQMADIDLSGYANWDPIGEATTGTGHFSGHYDGNGFAVSNLTMSYSDFRAVGLFGSLFNGSIKNLGVENVNINCSGAVFCAGGLVGTASSDNKSLYNITNCYSEGTVISTKCVGLLVGSNGAPVIKCWSEGSVRAETYQYADAGGLVGHQSSHSIENSCSYANVEGVIAGGLLGTSYSGAEVINSYSGGTVRGSGMSGGLVGYSYSIYVTNCYSKCSVELTPANPSSIGGLLGYDDSTTIIYSYYDSTVSGQSDTGKGVPKTTAEMKQQATFVGWDFDTVWGIDPTINDGYPYLQWQSFDSPYAFANGAGTEADPYQVWTADDLNGVRDYPSSHFIQMKHIDLSGYPDWVPIGTATFEGEEVDSNTVFSGFYNGNGYKISNLNVLTGVTMGGGFAGGLFGLAADLALINSGEPSENPPEIKNIILENVNINGGEGLLYAGGLVAYSYGIIISNCSVSGSINGYYGAGGLVGFGMVTVDNSFSSCSVVSPSGIAGSILGEGSGTVNNCYSNGTASCLYTEATGAITMAYGCQIVSSYYDSDIAGISAEFDPDYPGYHIATAKTTAEMKQQETFVGWDFDTVWGIDPAINEGYPYLKVFVNEEIPTIYQFTYGSGTEADPYQVWTADDLNGVRDHLSAYFIQMADVDLSGYPDWVPIGEDIEDGLVFSGSYDGNGYKISNLTVLTGYYYAESSGTLGTGGLFGACAAADLFDGQWASLKNISLENVKIGEITEGSPSLDTAGGLAAIVAGTFILNCYVSGSISSLQGSGGLIGAATFSVIENSYSTCSVSATSTDEDSGISGSIVGSAFGVKITNCYSNGISYNGNPNYEGVVFMGWHAEIISSYYNSDIAGISTELDPQSPGFSIATPKTTFEMKQQETYVDWDFDTIWGIDPAKNDGYPYLRVFDKVEEPEELYQFTYGSGTETDPYQVWTADDLNGVNDYLSSYFIQMADIDLYDIEWVSLSNFEGNYNGNGYKITNITSALFGSTKFATLKNIGLENVNITDSNGALANAILSGTIEGCYSTGTISCTGSHLGGLIGHIQGFTLDFITEIPPVIKNCYSTCTVTSTGENIDGGDQGIGIGGLFGVLGYTFGYGQIENCYSCGQVSKTSADVNINLGGLIGFIKNSRGTITNCFYDSTASGQSDQGKGEPKTTSQMKLEPTYVGWDFDTIWGINKLVNNGYPFLKANISSDIAEERDFFVRSRLPITFPAIVPSSYPILIEKHSPAAIDRPLRQESNETIFPAIEMTAGLTQVELVNKTDQAIIKPGADLSVNITDANYGSRSEQINIDPSIELSIDIFDISTSKFEEQETINPSLEINISYRTIQE